MNNTIIARSIKTSLFIGMIGFALLSHLQPPSVVWGLLFGTLASAANLWILSRFLQTVFASASKPDQKKMALYYALLKFPAFYGLLIFLLYILRFSIYSFMIGFSVPLVVIVLKSVGPVLIGRERAFPWNGIKDGE
jgi:hypothetical protein